ncbi:MAG: C1 family peptidase [Euryarchaeota archaeon]|nr:C1 family peptidase [Euryarchaeota archaeon]
MGKKGKCKKAIGIVFAVIIAVSVFAVAIPGIASESSNTPATAEQMGKIEIEELQQRVYEQGYNYTVAENGITCLSPEEKKALCGYKHLKAPTEPLPENVGFVLDVPKAETKIGSPPPSYDAMALGYVTPIKNQICGACWLHGAIADFESDVAIGESNLLDLSEQEVGDCNIWASAGGHNYCNGGNALMTTNYFTKYGAADEACNPYVATPQTCQNCPILKNVDNWRMVTGDDGESQIYISTIKNAILNYGPVYSTIYASDPGFSAYDSGVYEYWGTGETDHAIEIIGWDNTLSHSHGNGAWLIKNSWGTGWGASGPYPGCAWVAYGAANLGDATSAISGYSNADSQTYFHDECGWMGYCAGCDAPTAYGAVRFIPTEDSTLTAVDFWAVDADMQYEIKIFDSITPVGSKYTFSDQLGTTQTGTTNESGYYSIPLDMPVQLTCGDGFIVQVKLTTTEWKYPIPIDYCNFPWLNWSAIATSSGESYASCDGSQFEKYGTGGKDIGIRARLELPQPDIWVDPTSFDVTLPANTTQNYTLTIGNIGDTTLTYTISDRTTTGGSGTTSGESPTTRESMQHEGLIQLSPSQPRSFPTLPTAGTEVEIAYDDGVAENAYDWTAAGDGFAVRFTPPQYPVNLKVARFCFWPEWPDADHEQFGVEIYDDGSGGVPGTLLGGGTTTASDWGWCNVDISPLGITINEGDFYILYKQLSDHPDCEGLCIDTSEPLYGRSWDYWDGAWSLWEDENYMIRCVVEVGGGNNPPYEPSNPSPTNNATGVSIDADLSWSGGDPDLGDTVTYDVWFGSESPIPKVSEGQTATSYDPGTLESNTKYYWAVDAIDNHGAKTDSPIWDFTTTAGGGEDCPWLDEDPRSGSVPPAGHADITVTINTAGLAEGDYNAQIVIANNDPDENPVIIPVHLSVTPSEELAFDTGKGTYPSISGMHIGTITPAYDINISHMYTYPCTGTGGHTEYVWIYGNGINVSETWTGYSGDWHNITFGSPFVLEEGEMYYYEIRTGSYPQIIHESSKDAIAGAGTITCDKFIDANGKTYNNWIPAIRLE